MSNLREVTIAGTKYRKQYDWWEEWDESEWRWFAVHDPTLIDALLAMQTERDEARGMVFSLFNQACLVSFDHAKYEGTYDHMAISFYEDAQAALIEWGVIRADQCKGR